MRLFSILMVWLLSILIAASPGFAKSQAENPLGVKVFEHVQGHFKQQKSIHELGVEIKTEGTFQISHLQDNQGYIFHWNVEVPKPSQVCMDSKGLVVNSGGKKKKIGFEEMGADSSKQMTSLLKLMSLDPQKIATDFKIDKQQDKFLLTPKSPNTVFFEQALVRVNAVGLVDWISLKEKSKDELNIQFSNLKTKNIKILKPCAL